MWFNNTFHRELIFYENADKLSESDDDDDNTGTETDQFIIIIVIIAAIISIGSIIGIIFLLKKPKEDLISRKKEKLKHNPKYSESR